MVSNIYWIFKNNELSMLFFSIYVIVDNFITINEKAIILKKEHKVDILFFFIVQSVLLFIINLDIP